MQSMTRNVSFSLAVLLFLMMTVSFTGCLDSAKKETNSPIIGGDSDSDVELPTTDGDLDGDLENEAPPDGDMDAESDGDEEIVSEEEMEKEVVELPQGTEIVPGIGEGDVHLSASVTIRSDSEFESADAVAFQLFEGASETGMDGSVYLSLDKKAFHFWPARLLHPNETYRCRFTLGDTSYETDFSTVAEAGSMPLAGNFNVAMGGEGEYASFHVKGDTVLDPFDLAESILNIADTQHPLLALLDFDGEPDGEGMGHLAYADSMDFGEDDVYEVNHTSTAILIPQVAYHGKYFHYSGSFTLTRGEWGSGQSLQVSIDNLFIAGYVKDDGSLWFNGGLYVSDCSTLAEFYPEEDYIGIALALVCDPVNDDFFAYGTADGETNAMADVVFAIDTEKTNAGQVVVTLNPGLDAKYARVDHKTFNVSILDASDGEVFNSEDHADSVAASEFTKVGDEQHYTFNDITVTLPSALATGTYKIKLWLSLYAWEGSFTIE